ncbi:MAG: dienelactone hydrolase family protein, partial [Pseudomonadota bacterium]
MCDETTERELDTYLARRALSRRAFTTGASISLAATALLPAACATPEPASDPALATLPLTETNVLIPMPGGDADGLFVHPAEGAHAAVIMWPDIHGVRPTFFDMARRLAGSGYSVIAVNPYYRTMQGRLFQDGESIRDPGGRERVSPHVGALTNDTVISDSR